MDGAILHQSRPSYAEMIERGWGRIINVSGLKRLQGQGRVGARVRREDGRAWTHPGAGRLSWPRTESESTTSSPARSTRLVLDIRHPRSAGEVEGIPAGRLGLPEEIGKTVVFLASDAADYITGQTIHVNGGALTW